MRMNICELCSSISETYKDNAKKVVLINTSDVYEGKCTNHTFVDNKNLKGQFKKTFRPNDILYSEIRPANRRFAYIDFDTKDYIASTKLMVIRANKGVNPKYLYQLLRNNTTINTLQMLAESRSGTFPQITFSELSNIEIDVPSEENQDLIVTILSSLDAKIETNNKLNEKMEEMAQAIFKSWFVDFEPFKDNPFHETELGMIPEGWEVGIFDDIVDIVGGGTPSKSIAEYYTDNGIAWITPKDLSLNNNKFTSKGTIDITELGYEKSSAKLMPKGSVLFSSRAPIGYITIAKNEICTNQGFKSAVPKKAGTAFVYYLLKNKTIEIENMATGSTFKEASGTLMKNLKIIMPLDKVLDDFEKIIMPIFEFQMSVEEQNDRLASLRDTLLPRLMSGEIKI